MGELFQVFEFMSGIIAQQSVETVVAIVQSNASILNETGRTSDKYDLHLWMAHQLVTECKTYSGDLYRRLIRILPLKGKLPVTRKSRNSIPDSILDPRKFRESTL